MSDWVKYDKAIRLHFASPVIRVAEQYFTSSGSPLGRQAGVDVFAALFHHEDLAGWRSYPSATRVVDLRASEDEIFGNFSRSNRHNIKLARSRDGTLTAMFPRPSGGELEEFMRHYDEFAESKRLPRVHRGQLHALMTTGKLVLSEARRSDGSILAAHAYIREHDRVRLTHSASLFRLEQEAAERGRIGRANRLLHWDDLLSFRSTGALSYDLGGWYIGESDQALVSINSFKREFGGETLTERNSFSAGSKKGSLYLACRDLMIRTRT